MHILVVLEDAAQAAAIADAFACTGANVEHVATTDRALVRISEDMPDALVVDLGLPRTSAFELLPRLHVRTVAVALTRIDTQDLRAAARAAGFAACLADTASPATIVQIVQGAAPT
jgi:DNA-binding response OmpR family regulator